MPGMIRPADIQRDAAAIAAIYEPFCLETPVTFEYEAPDADVMADRIARIQATHPWLVYEEQGQTIAYAYAAPYRTRTAYQWSAEVSIYSAESHRRRGIGRDLYRELFNLMRRQRLVNVYAGITLPNDASVAFHETLGFRKIGIYPHAGFKLGKWHDVGWWEMRLGPLPTVPLQPISLRELS